MVGDTARGGRAKPDPDWPPLAGVQANEGGGGRRRVRVGQQQRSNMPAEVAVNSID